MSDENVQSPENTKENEESVKTAAKAKPRKRKKTASKKAPSKSAKSVKPPDTSKADRKARRTTLFPITSFEEALVIPNAIQKHAAGQQVRRLTLFDQLGKSPDSGPSRQLITNANKYGLIKGNFSSEHLELTPEGRLATASEDVSPKDRLSTRFNLAIERISPFKSLYEALKGSRVPASSVLEDLARDKGGVPGEETKECVELFIVNAKAIGILKPIAGAERILPIEQVLEELPTPTAIQVPSRAALTAVVKHTEDSEGFDSKCFYISPIGNDDSEHRLHADLFLASIVEPALEEFGLKVIRADKIGKPGMITSQIVEHIVKSRLVIADLSFHNPNVFYELALRHVCRLPTVQIIRKGDKIPFDLDQFRTILIDNSSIYSMIPNLQTYRAEVAAQVRMALNDPDSVDNPISTYYPSLRVSFEEV